MADNAAARTVASESVNAVRNGVAAAGRLIAPKARAIAARAGSSPSAPISKGAQSATWPAIKPFSPWRISCPAAA